LFSIAADESTMTGEPHAVDKDLIEDPFMLVNPALPLEWERADFQ
jgi:hypothetical protein